MSPIPSELRRRLEVVEIFSDLNQAELGLLTKNLRQLELKSGETLFHQGDSGVELYVVGEGQVSVSLQIPDGERIELKRFGQGEFFGEMSIFEHMPRSADCVALEPTILFALHKDDFFGLIETKPQTAIRMMYRMLGVTTHRLLNISEFHSEMVLWGRRFLDSAFEEQFNKARRNGSQLAVLMIDLDHFNTINDTCGLPVGDEILTAAADIFKSSLGLQGIGARYGGDEFSVLLPGMGVDGARAVAEAIRAGVEAMDIPAVREAGLPGVTTSQGLAVYPLHAHDALGLLEAADKGVYRAKERGRNRVELPL
ncbi:MAG: GGDEF domain-containing protein [Spirochaeta sp.]|nr:GGDEF domain-containing protein [Spirochaeta sp.]